MFKKIFGSRNDRYIKSIQPLISKINGYKDAYEALNDDDLKHKTFELKERYQQGESLDDLLPEAFAVVREGAKRALGIFHYDVQLIGGIILHQNRITEMKTGEGKTLVATLPAYLNALTGDGVHVVTVNEYLAKRDAEWMGEIFKFLGMSCGYVISGLSSEERREAYAADITYATNNELGFDFLRDNMAFDPSQLVQRGLNYAIVDEVDSILIDEARTPLIISGPSEDKTDLYKIIDDILPDFVKNEHYEVDEKSRQASLTDEGTDKAESILRTKGLIDENTTLYAMENVVLVHHINNALRAHHCYHRDIDYIIQKGKAVLIDEFTGRMMEGRRLGAGLHQAIEAKESLEIQSENQTLASTTFQNYFRMYKKLAGMTGTADTEAEEFQSIYNLPVMVVPTHVAVARQDEADSIFRTKEEKDRAIIRDIAECYERGQPVLVGTTSIEKSEHYAALLKKKKIKHQVLNARHHEQEADIIAQAGRLGAVTIATNMAGRGTDIKLGGNLDLLLETAKTKKQHETITSSYAREKEEVLSLGGLRVLGTERNESRRVDNQLRGRSGRQGDPGSSVFYISLQDDLMRLFGRLDQVMEHLDMPKDEAIKSRLVTRSIETAQRKIESRNFDMRKQILKFDNVLNDQRKVIYDQRREVLEADDVSDIILGFREESLEVIFTQHMPEKNDISGLDIAGLKENLQRIFGMTPDIDARILQENTSYEMLFEVLQREIDVAWHEKEGRLGEKTLRQIEKGVLLQTLDHQWKEHLQRLDFLRQGIGLRGYGQKDPLQEFKREAFDLFDGLLSQVREETVSLLSRIEIAETQENKREAVIEPVGNVDKNPYKDMNIARNDLCPCGSGKKYKHCHGAL